MDVGILHYKVIEVNLNIITPRVIWSSNMTLLHSKTASQVS